MLFEHSKAAARRPPRLILERWAAPTFLDPMQRFRCSLRLNFTDYCTAVTPRSEARVTSIPWVAALVVLALTVSIEPSRIRQEPTFVVRNVRVFDGERVAERRDVLVENGLISRVGATGFRVPLGATVIEGRGRTLLPGLIDAHVHLSDSATADLRQALSLGVTTVFDMFSGSTRFEEIKALRSADPPDIAAVRTAGVGATAPGGHPSQMGGPPFPTIADSGEAVAFVNARIAEGSDYIKIIYDDLSSLGMAVPMLDRRTLAGLIAAAHAQGKLAVVHVLSEEQARVAIEAQADGLAHLFTGASVSPDFARLVASHHAFVIPTLTVLYGSCGQAIGSRIVADSLLRPYIRPSLRRMMPVARTSRAGVKSCEGTKEAIRQLAQQGVPILAGTDAPVPGQTYGASLHGELELLVGAGLTPAEALTAATSAPARAFGLTDRGRISPGLRADLVLVEGDPTAEIVGTRRIVMVWKRGVLAERPRYEE
jgi:imidazolonepropionase-like amidohydrolase